MYCDGYDVGTRVKKSSISMSRLDRKTRCENEGRLVFGVIVDCENEFRQIIAFIHMKNVTRN